MSPEPSSVVLCDVEGVTTFGEHSIGRIGLLSVQVDLCRERFVKVDVVSNAGFF